jgi:hypothetical protein
MKPLCKMIALVMLVAVVSPALFGQVFVLVPAQAPQPRPAGCHEHGQKVPSPSPVTYQCCRVGHQFATVRDAVSLRAPFVTVSRAEVFGISSLPMLVCQTLLKPLVSGSPGITALRI